MTSLSDKVLGSYFDYRIWLTSLCSLLFSSILFFALHRLQHTRVPCPSLTPRVFSNSCPLTQWCQPTISSSVAPFSSCLQSFPASGSFPMSWLRWPVYWSFSCQCTVNTPPKKKRNAPREQVYCEHMLRWWSWHECGCSTVRAACPWPRHALNHFSSWHAVGFLHQLGKDDFSARLDQRDRTPLPCSWIPKQTTAASSQPWFLIQWTGSIRKSPLGSPGSIWLKE